jgi:chromosome segregation ATPase
MSSRERSLGLERELANLRDEVRTLQARATDDAADIARLREELGAARTRIATLERDPDIVQAFAFRKRLAETEAARAASERVASKAVHESRVLDDQLASVREEIRRAREQMTADAVASAAVADELAALRREAQLVKAQSLTALLTATAELEAQISELSEHNASATARANEADAKLRAAELRAQHAEASVEQANARAAIAEARIAHLDKRAADHGVLARQADEEYAQARKQIVALETHLAALNASVAATQARSSKRTEDLTSEHAPERAVDMVAAAGEIAGVDPMTPDATERAIRVAAALADQQIREAARRVEDAENRANAADTIAKAMATDVAVALRRAVEADLKVRYAPAELEAAHRRAEEAEAENAKAAAAISNAERQASEAEARASRCESELQSANEEVRRISGSRAALDVVRRELAAERSTSVALADCKRQLDGELTELRAQLSAAIRRFGVIEQRNIELEREVETADNVRSFAAETEREIAQLQRQLHDARSELAELASDQDRESTNPRAVIGEDTARYNVSALEELVTRATGLENRVVELERDNARLRDQLARAKRSAR